MKYAIKIDKSFHEVYPNAAVGVMIVENAINSKDASDLDDLKQKIEVDLRQNFSEKAVLRNLPAIQAYKTYYKQFKKSYHVLFQLESVIFDGRSIPNSTAMVKAMFMAELDNMLLTAGHDLECVNFPVTIGVAQGNETYTLMNGNTQIPKAKDMCMSDQNAIISSVIYGPDQHTRIQSKTQNAMFVVYAPDGIEKGLISKHLGDIYRYINLFSPNAIATLTEIF